jgi:hypothetical protein
MEFPIQQTDGQVSFSQIGTEFHMSASVQEEVEEKGGTTIAEASGMNPFQVSIRQFRQSIMSYNRSVSGCVLIVCNCYACQPRGAVNIFSDLHNFYGLSSDRITSCLTSLKPRIFVPLCSLRNSFASASFSKGMGSWPMGP